MALRQIVVVEIQSGTEVVVVRNPSGKRRNWQLPGGTMQDSEDDMEAAVRKIVEEVGLNPDNACVESMRNVVRGIQCINVFRASFDQGMFDELSDVGPNGHEIRLAEWSNLDKVLTAEDRVLLQL